VAGSLKTMVANTPLQPRCNHQTRNYRNHVATTEKQGATTPQPSQFNVRNYRNRSLKTGRMVAGQQCFRFVALKAPTLRTRSSIRSTPNRARRTRRPLRRITDGPESRRGCVELNPCACALINRKHASGSAARVSPQLFPLARCCVARTQRRISDSRRPFSALPALNGNSAEMLSASCHRFHWSFGDICVSSHKSPHEKPDQKDLYARVAAASFTLVDGKTRSRAPGRSRNAGKARGLRDRPDHLLRSRGGRGEIPALRILDLILLHSAALLQNLGGPRVKMFDRAQSGAPRLSRGSAARCVSSPLCGGPGAQTHQRPSGVLP
jgi:hypothetical protein